MQLRGITLIDSSHTCTIADQTPIMDLLKKRYGMSSQSLVKQKSLNQHTYYFFDMHHPPTSIQFGRSNFPFPIHPDQIRVIFSNY